jgi:hypothetical protein
MAKYTQLISTLDPALTITEANLLEADVYVDLALGNIGITAAEALTIVLPNATLTSIASAWAKRCAAIEGAMGENSPLIDKAKQYKDTAELLIKMLNRTSIGIVQPTGTSYGVITLGRG